MCDKCDAVAKKVKELRDLAERLNTNSILDEKIRAVTATYLSEYADLIETNYDQSLEERLFD